MPRPSRFAIVLLSTLIPSIALSHLCIKDFASFASDREGIAMDAEIRKTYISLMTHESFHVGLDEFRRIADLTDLFDVDRASPRDLLELRKNLATFRDYLGQLGKDTPETYQALRGELRKHIQLLEQAKVKQEEALKVKPIKVRIVVNENRRAEFELYVQTYKALLDNLGGKKLTQQDLNTMLINGNPYAVPEVGGRDLVVLNNKLREFENMVARKGEPEMAGAFLLEYLQKLPVP